jgi:uncharacterized membrane protein
VNETEFGAMWMGLGSGWIAIMWISMIVFWTIVAAGIWAFFASMRRSGEHSVEEILMRRYANGEITNEEYQSRLRELRHSR